MVLAPNLFEFEAHVSVAGYRWLTRKQIGAARIVGERGKDVSTLGPFLVEATEDFAAAGSLVARYPTTNPGLFRDFASIDPTDLEAMRIFANAHGQLGVASLVQIDEKKTCLPAALAGEDDYEGRLGKLSETGLRMNGMNGTHCELRTSWIRSIAEMRAAVNVLDAIRGTEGHGADKERLRGLFRWLRPSSRVPLGGWAIDTLPNRPTTDPERVWRSVASSMRLGEFSPIEDVALAYLVQEINSHLALVRPVLVAEPGGKVTERLFTGSLLPAMWCQVFTALTEAKDQRKCLSCGKWFEVDRRDGRTDRKVYCDVNCRVRDSQRRRETAERMVQQLADEGLKPKQIVERLKGEGYETDLDTVKVWMENSSKRK